MGNDGGSIPDRRDLVRNKPKAEQADKANQTRARWFFCALSKRKLQEPIVSCALGKIYNKDSIIEYLLDKSLYGDGEKICGHIKSLKDVKELKLTPNPTPSTPESDLEHAQFVCPLTLKEMNGAQPFVYIATCGCVFTQAGLKTVSSKSKSNNTDNSSKSPSPESDTKDQLQLCPQCATKYSQDDIIPLNPSSEDEEKLYLRMEHQRLLEPPKKSKTKTKKRKAEEDSSTTTSKKRVHSSDSPSLNPSMAASSRAVAKSLKEEEVKRKAGMSEAVKSLYGNPNNKTKETFMTMGTFTRYA
ncbi:Rtf2 RING-finger-domain-containing protein [Cyathus striatus]|nr:Rtf2 RING-finger-domain-containing protein [Cyathus striatus]